MKNIKKTTSVLLSLLMIVSMLTVVPIADVSAEDVFTSSSTLTVNDGTDTNKYVPTYFYYADAFLKSQFVITADQIEAAVPSKIKGMRFYCSSLSSKDYTSNFQVYIGKYEADTIESFQTYTDKIMVYEGTLSIKDNLMDIVFSNDYPYTGGNLLVTLVSTTKGNYAGAEWYGYNSDGKSVQGYSTLSVGKVEPTQRNFAPKTTFAYEKIAAHTHSFSSFNAEGAEITATCSAGGCFLDNSSAKLTLNAPEKKDASDFATPRALLSGLENFYNSNVSISQDDIRYYDETGETLLNEVPTTEGSYIARYTLEGATASVSYTIAEGEYTKPTPTSIDGKGITKVVLSSSSDSVTNTETPTVYPYYGDYSNISVDADPGDDLAVDITFETGYTYGTIIFVDWNKNYRFEENEVVYKGTSTNSNPTTLNAGFTIPENVTPRKYRMRICAADSHYDGFIAGTADFSSELATPATSYCMVHDYSIKVSKSCASHVIHYVKGVKKTCTADGSKSHFSCDICGRNFKDVQGTEPIANKDLVIPAGHAWSDWHVTQPATCTEPGTKERTCADCLETQTEEIPAAGSHSYGEFVDNGNGTMTTTCTECGASKTYTGTKATVRLTAGHVFHDDSGYQMLLDADANTYGSVIPTDGALTSSGDASPEVYNLFEYKIPTNADGSMTTQNIVFNNSIAIDIPAGVYDFCITNPVPNDRIWIASNYGNIYPRQDNYTFLPGYTYEFTMSLDGIHDSTTLTITEGNVVEHEHSWTYTAHGTTITAHCTEAGCPFTQDPTMTISAPQDDLTADGTEKLAAFTEDYNTYAFADPQSVVVYTQDGKPIEGKPTRGGTYTATITYGDASASVEYTLPHEHSWSYVTDGTTIIAYCDTPGCPITEDPILTIGAPEGSLVADDTEKTVVFNDDYDNTIFPDPVSKVVYKQGGEPMEGKPKVEGTYTASVTYGGATASVEYTLTHDHSWTYTANGNTITAHCDAAGCAVKTDPTLTISAPQGDIIADGTAKTPVFNEGYNTSAFAELEDAVTYSKDGTAIQGKPIQPGEYTATVTYGDASVSVSYTITHEHSWVYYANGTTISAHCTSFGCPIFPDPTLTISAPGEGDGNTPVFNDDYNTVAFPNLESKITYTKDSEPFTGTPTEAGTYTATVTYGEASATVSYEITHVHSWTYSVNGKTITAHCDEDGCSVTTDPTLTISAPQGDIIADGTDKTAVFNDDYNTSAFADLEDAVAYSKDGSPINGKPKAPGTYTATVTYGDVSASVEYTIIHEHSWNYTANGTTITANCTAYGCSVTTDPTLTISAPEGDLVTDGTDKLPVFNEGYDNTVFPNPLSKVSYTKDGSPFDGKPKEAGEYTATITYGTASASVTYTIEKGSSIEGTSLSLDGDIAVNFYFTVLSRDLDNAKLVLSRGEETKTYLVSELEPDSDVYRVSFKVAAAEMTDVVNAKLYVGNNIVSELDQSVAMYAKRVLADKDGEITAMYGEANTAKLQKLCKEMLIYGAKSQNLFGYRTEDLADAGLDYTLEDLTAAEKKAIGTTNFPDLSEQCGIKYVGSTLLLRTKTSFRLYFTVTDQDKLDALTVKLDNEKINYGTKGDYIYFEITDMPAATVLDDYTLTFGDTPVTVNAGSYIVACQKDNGETLKPATTALYRYCKAAQDYFVS